MNDDLYLKAAAFMRQVFTRAGLSRNPKEQSSYDGDIEHHERCARIVRELRPDADEPMMIAAVTHDIERGIYGDWKAGSDNKDALACHQDMCATIVEMFLRKEGAREEVIQRVRHLVGAHEWGGDEDQNLLCDADCLAYFEEKALRLAKTHKEKGKTKDEVRAKLDHVKSRLHLVKAKALAEPLYEAALAELEK